MGRQLGLQHESRKHIVDRVRIDCGKHDLLVERTGHGDLGRAVCGESSEHAVILPRHAGRRCSAPSSTGWAPTRCSKPRSPPRASSGAARRYPPSSGLQLYGSSW